MVCEEAIKGHNQCAVAREGVLHQHGILFLTINLFSFGLVVIILCWSQIRVQRLQSIFRLLHQYHIHLVFKLRRNSLNQWSPTIITSRAVFMSDTISLSGHSTEVFPLLEDIKNTSFLWGDISI